MSFTRTAAGGLLRRLAGGPEALRCTGTATQSISTTSTTSTSPLPPNASSLHSSTQTSRFSTSAPCAARRRPRFSNVSAVEMGLVNKTAIKKYSEDNFPQYSDTDREALRNKYTPEQYEAIELSESATDRRDLAIQGRLRTLAQTQRAGINYLDDFSKLRPVVDRRPVETRLSQKVATDFDVMTDERFFRDTVRWVTSLAEDKGISADELETMSDEQRRELVENFELTDVDLAKYLYERPSFVKRNGHRVTAEEMGNDRTALGLPYILDGEGDKDVRPVVPINPDDEGLDEGNLYRRLRERTGMKVSELQGLVAKKVTGTMVSQQTRLGKILSWRVMAIAGNANGSLGIGSFRSTDHSVAMAKAKEKAILNMRRIPRYEDRTIFGNVDHKISGTVVRLFASTPGYGLRVPPVIFEMARAAGIHDLAAKIPRSRNQMNVVKCTYAALMKQRDPEQIAIGRGKKMVDVRKVYFGGAVY